jgi:hypothetical protein
MNTAQAIDRMRQIIRRQHKALSTEDCYIFWLRRYMAAVRQMSPELPNPFSPFTLSPCNTSQCRLSQHLI